jgi:hypothetical protein
MSKIPRFAEYAAAFEKAYESDDWSLIEPFFTEDAVYEVPDLPPPFGPRVAGRDAILAYFPRVLDAFDRRFASRSVGILEGPHAEGDRVRVRGSATYTAPGVPDLRFALEETAHFDGDRICRLVDRYTDGDVGALLEYLRMHGKRLGIEIGSISA